MWWAERSRSSSLAAFPDAGLGGQLFTVGPIDLFLRHEHARSGNENLVTIVEALAPGPPTASSGRMKIDDKVRLEGAR
jgi:hypothetical protein